MKICKPKQLRIGCSSNKQNEQQRKIDQDLEFISICVKSSQYIIIHNLSNKKPKFQKYFFSVK